MLLLLCLGALVLPSVQGHGYLIMPPGRSSAWRMNGAAHFYTNYDDNQNYCGGYNVQHNTKNSGRCGICGDDYSQPVPRDNERGGHYYTGNLVAEYQEAGIIEAVVVITANHRGRFYFDLDPSNNKYRKENEERFIPLMLDDRTDSFLIPHGKADTFHVRLRLPEDLTCQYCVLRWRYITANSWGCVDDRDPRTCCTGCGNKQEHFYSCSDIRITQTGRDGLPEWELKDPMRTTTPRPTTTRYPSTTTSRTTTTTTTRRPVRPTRRPVRTTTLATTTENPVCDVWCSKMCKPHFHAFCDRKLCAPCLQFRRYLVDSDTLG